MLMVVKRMTASQAHHLVRKVARKNNMSVVQVTKPQGGSRGKGSHAVHALLDQDGNEVARFGLTGHAEDMSWKLLRRLEDTLAPWFGQKWMEKR